MVRVTVVDRGCHRNLGQVTAERRRSWLAVAAVMFGVGHGLCVVSGLLEVQRLAGPDDLAGLAAAGLVVVATRSPRHPVG